MVKCSFRHVKAALFPEPDLLKFLSTRGWKFQIALAAFLLVFLVFTVIDSNEVTAFYVTIAFTFRCVTLLCSQFSGKFFLAGCMACVVVDSVCTIMSHGDMQNTWWLPMYEDVLGKKNGPPCPWCFPDIEGSMIFGIEISYMLMFVLPFSRAACVVPPCFAAYVSCLVYARWTNYTQFGEKLEQDVKHLTVEEILFLSGIVAVNIVSKFIMDSSDSELWYALKDSQGTVLHEKILRCKAEYASECLKTGATTFEKDAIPSSFCASSVHSPHMSAFSAPPILESLILKTHNEDPLASQCSPLCGGDCLQADDVVWTNESPHPIPVKQLAQGQHVLCYDHLSKHLKHAEVLNVAMHADSAQWATITLADGASLRVTADHPFLTELHGKHAICMSQAPVRACELEPHISKVLVMKLVPVDVQSVKLDPLDDLGEQARIAIDIQQPTRHSVMVASRDQPSLESAVAVGASNLDFPVEEYFMEDQKTFLNIFTNKPSLRRTNSSPGCLESVPREVTVAASVVKSGSGTGNSRSTPSTLSSEVTSAGADDCTIRIGTRLRPDLGVADINCAVQTVPGPDGQGHVGLQDYLHLRRMGLPSVGSFLHCERTCTAACWFENQRQHGRSKQCSLGMYCARCHFDHEFLKRGRRSRRREAAEN